MTAIMMFTGLQVVAQEWTLFQDAYSLDQF